MDRIALDERHRRTAGGGEELSRRMARGARAIPDASLTVGVQRLSKQRIAGARAEANAAQLHRRERVERG
jgi:hypothetical protein